MRIHIIACRVLSRELNYHAARSQNIVDVTYLPQGLHDTPDLLRRMIAGAIDELYRQRERQMLKHFPDAIALGYGLCSNGVIGLTSRDVPLVVPRTDDCIALFLGSQRRYLDLFGRHPGAYWLNNGWIEQSFVPTKEALAARRGEYARLYGEDNADFLLEQEMLWIEKYNTCAYIDSDAHQNPAYPDYARGVAESHGWAFARYPGDGRMLRALCAGVWDEREFLICPPRHRIIAAYDGSKLACEPLEG